MIFTKTETLREDEIWPVSRGSQCSTLRASGIVYTRCRVLLVFDLPVVALNGRLDWAWSRDRRVRRRANVADTRVQGKSIGRRPAATKQTAPVPRIGLRAKTLVVQDAASTEYGDLCLPTEIYGIEVIAPTTRIRVSCLATVIVMMKNTAPTTRARTRVSCLHTPSRQLHLIGSVMSF